MTKRSRFERQQRDAMTERVKEIERAWHDSTPAAAKAEFAAMVKAAQERGPWVRPPDMAPGTPPRPPRPGREPKPKKDDAAARRRY